MKLTVSLLATLAAIPTAFAASQPNAFNVPPQGYNTASGQSLDLKWNPTTSGTVTLVLRSGSSSNLEDGTVIASGIQNSGAYTWAVPQILRGSDYTIEIVSDSDHNATNYSPYFVIDSDVTVATMVSSVSIGAPTASLPGSATGTLSDLSTSSASASGSGAAVAAADVGSMTKHSSKTDSSMTSMVTSTSSDAASSASTSASTTNADADATTTEALSSTGGAVAQQAPLLAAGVIALGALVL